MVANFETYISDRPDVIAICCYDYKGVVSSTRNLCPNRIETRAVHHGKSKDEKFAIYHGLMDTVQFFNCNRIVVSGFHHDYKILFQVFKERNFTNVAMLWPGTIMEMYDPYIRNSFIAISELYDDNVIKVIGFVKKGFDVICDALGFDTYHIPNFVNEIPKCVSPLSDDGLTHIGIFQVYDAWYKRSHAMLAATKLIPNSVVHLHGGPKKDYVAYLDLMKIQLDNGHTNAVHHDKMPEVLSDMDLVMAVTFAESTPILPLESLSVGTPCLMGPTSDLFLTEYDNDMFPAADYLYDALVVPHPDDSEMIAEYANRVLGEREQIIENYIDFAIVHNDWCKKEFREFVDLLD